MREHEWTRVLGWPGYKVYRMEIDERGKHLKLWVRRKKTGLKLIGSRCGQHVPAATIHEVCEREVLDLPCFEYTTTRPLKSGGWALNLLIVQARAGLNPF
jgi:hypothetical protein